MATLREEATALISILPNPGKYSEKLAALLAATENANAALAALQAAEDVKATTTAARLEQQENLIALLTTQSDEIATANAAAAAARVAAENDLARREAAFDEAKQAHADQVEHDLRNCAFREEAIARKEAELGAVAEARVKDLHAGQAAVRDQHKVLHATIAEARQRIAAIAA
jgi:hypothetical protein